MKRYFIAAAVAAAVLSLSACSAIDTNDMPSESSLTESTTVAQTVETSTETTAAVSEASVDYDEILEPLLNGLGEIDRLYCTNIPYDTEDTFTDEATGMEFARAVDSRFSSTSDISEFIDIFITKNLRESRYLAIIDSDNPMYVDRDGKLYLRQSGKGGGFAWTGEKAVVEVSDENSFTVKKAYDDFGASAMARITVVNTEAGWRIDSVELNAE